MQEQILQMQTLYTVAIKEDNRANAWARSILIARDTLEYSEPVLLPDYLKSSPILPIPTQKISKENKLFVYPNPAKKYFIIRYELKGIYDNIVITVSDISGKIIQKLHPIATRNYLVVCTDNYPSGTYFVRLFINGNEAGIQKLILH